MASVVRLVETIYEIFGNAPHMFLSIISHFRVSKLITRLSLQSVFKRVCSGCSSSDGVDGDPDPEPPAAPPIIILSQNRSKGGPQPQERDHGPPHLYASFSRSPSTTPKRQVSGDPTSTGSQLKPKPEPEPHPAPPVIILSRNKRPTSSSLPISSHPLPDSHLVITNDPVHKTYITAELDFVSKRRIMGSKASKLSPKGGKLQSSQEKKDKEEMKEPTNYYTHRSKSMRRKAGREGATDSAGSVSMGSGGAGGAV